MYCLGIVRVDVSNGSSIQYSKHRTQVLVLVLVCHQKGIHIQYCGRSLGQIIHTTIFESSNLFALYNQPSYASISIDGWQEPVGTLLFNRRHKKKNLEHVLFCTFAAHFFLPSHSQHISFPSNSEHPIHGERSIPTISNGTGSGASFRGIARDASIDAGLFSPPRTIWRDISVEDMLVFESHDSIASRNGNLRPNRTG